MIRKSIIIMLFLMILPVGGCWNKTELNDQAIVLAGGIDSKSSPGEQQVVSFTLQIANPVAMISSPSAAGGVQSKPFWTVVGSGRNLREAVNDLSPRVPKKIFFAQKRLMVVGEKAARLGLIPLIDQNSRSNELKENAYWTVAKGEAKQVMETEIPTFKSSGMALLNLFQNKKGSYNIMPVMLYEINYDLTTACNSPVLTVVEVVPESSVATAGTKKQGDTPLTIKVGGLAAFDHDGKMLAYLNQKETSGVMWVRRKFKQREMTLMCSFKDSQVPVTVVFHGYTCKTEVEMTPDGMPRFHIKVRSTIDLLEQFGVSPSTNDPSFLKSLSVQVNTEIKREIEAAVKRSQELDADFLQLGEKLKRRYPKMWEVLAPQWLKILPLVEVKVESTTMVRNRGLSSDTPTAHREVVGRL